MNDIFTVEHKGACRYMMGLFTMVHKGSCDWPEKLFTVVYFLILPLRRILPWLRSLPPFYYLKIVCGQNVCFRLSTSQPLPCRLHSLFYYWYALSMLHMSIIWAGYALPGAMWLIWLVCHVQTECLWLKCATFTVELVASFTVGIHRRSTLDTCGYFLYRDGALTHIWTTTTKTNGNIG
jgi:hypothetical protein